MEVGVDHCLDGLVGEFAELGHNLARLADRLAGVDDDQPFRRLDHHHVAKLPTDRRIDVAGNRVDLLGEVLGMGGQLGVYRRLDTLCRQLGQGTEW
ncbi:hypothetical protein D9M68_707710 [compost metagenome]